ncbi:MAG: hypothetical protein NTV43_06025 [Methylococcales bacterium]|nr:hypothetical protein [Methylococcales bacterium]
MPPQQMAAIGEKLSLDWNPELVSGGQKSRRGIRINHERIYQHAGMTDGRTVPIWKDLRQNQKKRKKCGQTIKPSAHRTWVGRVGLGN